MSADGYGFGLRDAKVATLTDESGPTWATAVDVDAVQMLGITFNTTSGQLEGDDVIKDSHSKVIGATVRMRFAFSGLNFAVWNVILGNTTIESGDDKYMVIAGENPPYFGICGKVEHTGGGGDLHLWVPKAKIKEGLSLEAQYGQYQTPELQVECLILNATHGICVPIEHATAANVIIPPVFGAA